MVHCPHMMAKETTLKEVGEMLGHVVERMAAQEDVARLDTRIDGLRTELIDQFEHVEKQFHATHNHLRDISSEIAVIHPRVERLEELAASNAGFAKEIDHLLRGWPGLRSISGSTRRLRRNPYGSAPARSRILEAR